MATQRQIQTDDEEMQRLQQGDVVGARAVLRRKKLEHEEEEAVDTFLRAHPEVMPAMANRSLLLAAARDFGGVVTVPLVQLAYAKIAANLAMTPPAPPPLTAAEIAAAERKRLLSLSPDELREEVRRGRRKPVSVNEIVSPELQAMTSRAGIDRLSADHLRKLMYREGHGSPRTGNIRRINELLQGKGN